MPELTIPGALAQDLRDLFLAATLPDTSLTSERVLLRNADGEPPSPRFVFLTREPAPVYRMDGTAKIPIEIQYVTSRDRVTDEQHQAVAGKLDDWFRSIRVTKRRSVISSRVYLHEITTKHPVTSTDSEDREQMTVLRGDFTVTLVDI